MACWYDFKRPDFEPESIEEKEYYSWLRYGDRDERSNRDDSEYEAEDDEEEEYKEEDD